MTDRYKDTLNLPYTDFPMKASLANREPEFLKQWEDNKIYTKLRQARAGKKKFILHDGPPYANGHTHLGHAVNKALKDIIVKAKSLSGFDAPFVPGWDCHGLPIELNIEKKYGKAGDKLSAKEFRAACRAYAQEQINIQRSEFKRLGVMADWDNPYVTMDFQFEANIIRALGKIIANGHLQQGFKPVHWCIDCGSALAEAEVEYANKTSSAIDVRFRVVNENEFLQSFEFKSSNKGEGPISVPIWTTTPWSLPANEAVALNPKLTGVLVQIKTDIGKERLLLAQELVTSAIARYGVENYEELATIPCAALEGFLLQHPFYDRQVPIILGEHVTTDTGTGAVHTAPAHGLEDFVVGQQYKLPLVNPVGGNGCYLPDVPLFAGEHVFKANAHLLEVLKEHHNLLCDKKLEHSYPHCWRHKIPLIFRATPQWFISMEQQGLRAKSMEQIAKTKWVPERGMARIASMVEQRPDWCISRQRFWGVPITLFIHNETDELHPRTMEILEKVAQLVEQKGIDAWDELNPVDLLGKEVEQYRKVTDTLDVWFDSGVTHYCVLEKNSALQFPADLYLEGSDQHRGWFQSSLLTAVAIHESAPYKAVLTHGFTVDEKGRKMSKSLGNVIAPEKVINTSGADILRLWISSTDYRNEITLSEEILKRTSEAYRRIRNTVRFLLANIHDFDPAQHLVPANQMLSLDRWAVARAQQLQQEIIAAYDNYQFHLVYQKVQNFCITDLGGFYLDIIKDRQYTLQKDSRARRSAQTALYHIAEAMVRWLAPILSFTAEEIWQFLPGKRVEASVFLSSWYDHLNVTNEHDQLADIYGKEGRQAYWDLIIQARDLINKKIEAARGAGLIGSALEAEIEVYCEPDSILDKALRALKDELRFVLMTSDARVLSLANYKGETPVITLANNQMGINVISIAETKTKCARCWHRRSDVGTHVDHPEICGRCVDNAIGKGEERFYA